MAAESQIFANQQNEQKSAKWQNQYNKMRQLERKINLNYAKQSQFQKISSERKHLWKKVLRKRAAPRAPQKQSQIKPNSNLKKMKEDRSNDNR